MKFRLPRTSQDSLGLPKFSLDFLGPPRTPYDFLGSQEHGGDGEPGWDQVCRAS